MDVRYLPNLESYRRMTTAELRQAFVLDQLFVRNKVTMVYCDSDRAIVGGAVPMDSGLRLEASQKEMSAKYFTERREVGIVDVGGSGKIRADKIEYSLERKDMLYIGRGIEQIEFFSVDSNDPAVFYFISFPAHSTYPVARVRLADAEPNRLGTLSAANRRTIYKYIHPGGAQSCQLVMGLTDLEQGSVWNTMPPHTHERRTEVYLYFDMDSDSLIVHLMGAPGETKSVVLRDREAIISPSWSIHCGAGTTNYSFVWAMGGENQEFSDMDASPMNTLL